MSRSNDSPSITDLNTLHKETYDGVAVEYDERAELHQSIVDTAIAEDLMPHVQPPARVLDIGCAVGNVTKSLIDFGYTADGIDISPAMIAFAQRRSPQAQFFVVDLMEYDPPYRYDAIVAFAFIHLFPREEVPKILRKIKALLKENGILYAGTTLSDTYSEGFEVKADYSEKHQRYRARWTRDELDKEMTAAGFTIVKVRTHVDGVGKTWMDYVVRKNSVGGDKNEI